MTTIVTNTLSALVIIGQLGIIVLTVMLIKRVALSERQRELAAIAAWVIALIAMSGSLFYSEIAHFNPCILCWYQRILMYPLVFILGTALVRRDRAIAPYALALTIPGILLSGYHYLLQIGLMPKLPCSTVGFSISCSERFFTTYGYVTIPMMAFTAFLLISLLVLVAGRRTTETATRP